MTFRLLLPSLFVALSLAAPAFAQKKDDEEEKAGPPKLKLLKAAISSPLFVQQSDGSNVMASVTLTATATPTSPSAPGTVEFTPTLGPAGKAMLAEVTKYLVTAHHGWPAGHRIEIASTPPMAPDDAMAAGVATVALLDAMIAGWESDPKCAVLGGFKSDGKIQPVSGALGRLTTAGRSGASRIVMAAGNATQAQDSMVNEGINGFCRVQIFTVRDFEDIPKMAAAKMDPDVAAAGEAFADFQKSLSDAGGDIDGLKNPDVQEDLRTVLEKWPDHFSARMLLGRAIGRYTTFSIPGSIEAIERVAVTLFKGIHSGVPYQVQAMPAEKITDEVERMRRAVDRVDPAAKGFAQAVLQYGEAALSYHKTPPKTQPEMNQLVAKLSATAGMAQDERQKLAALAYQQQQQAEASRRP